MRLAGVHQPARHLLHSHGMSTTHTPLETLFSTFCEQTSTSELRVFLGVGLYFLLLLLACHDVERHPGPFPLLNKYHAKLSVHATMVKMFPSCKEETIVDDDLIPLILELVTCVFEDYRYHKLENSKLTSRLLELEKRIMCLEKEQRRKNVVIFGVPTENDLDNVVNDVIMKKLSPKKQPKEEIIERAYRFGRDAPQRAILIRFKNEKDKARAMKLAPTLKGTNITISDDLTPEERLGRRKIVDAHKAARAENIDSKVQRQGLLVNGDLVPLAELGNSDWLDKFLNKVENVPLASVNESTPPVSPALSQDDDWLNAPKKRKAKKRSNC